MEGDAAADEAERQGIVRSHEALADADLVLLIHDATVAVSNEERKLAATLEGRPHLLVYNKIDLATDSQSSEALTTSALTGQGIDVLRTAILQQLQAEGALADAGALNNLRQQQAVNATLQALKAAQEANAAGLPHEIILMDLHAALRALDSLTGATTPDDILGLIFSTFCIGK